MYPLIERAQQIRQQLAEAAATSWDRAQSDPSVYWRSVAAQVNAETVQRMARLDAALQACRAGRPGADRDLMDCIAG